MVKRSQPNCILTMQHRRDGGGIQGVNRSGAMMGAQTDVHPVEDIALDTAREEPWTILVHNDDVTPYDFVVDTLGHVFSLSAEIAETVTWEAHHKGVAPVCSRAQSEAKRLISDAHSLARAAGYPLSFSMEPKL